MLPLSQVAFYFAEGFVVSSSGEAHNSPTHSSSISNQGSNNLVFGESGAISPTHQGGAASPATSPLHSPTRRDYILTKGMTAM